MISSADRIVKDTERNPFALSARARAAPFADFPARLGVEADPGFGWMTVWNYAVFWYSISGLVQPSFVSDVGL
jgi:hypothetical protein